MGVDGVWVGFGWRLGGVWVGVGDVWVGIGWSLDEGGLGFRWGVVWVGFGNVTKNHTQTSPKTLPPERHPKSTKTPPKPQPKSHQTPLKHHPKGGFQNWLKMVQWGGGVQVGLGGGWVGLGWSLGEGGLGYRWGVVWVGCGDLTPDPNTTNHHPKHTQVPPKPHPNTT